MSLFKATHSSLRAQRSNLRSIERLRLPRPLCGLAMTVLLLAACGFHPMYGDHSALAENSPLVGNLAIDKIGGHEGQIFKIALEDRLNPEGIGNSKPEYHLQVVLTKYLIPAVVATDGTVQRYDVKFDSNFKLIQSSDKKILLAGTLHRSGSYNVAVNANFATYEAEQDVIARVLKEMAEDYVLRLTGYFAGKK